MIKLPKTVSDFTGFLDGTDMAGRIDEATPPAVTLLTEEHMAGGMAGTLDIFMGGVEKLEMNLTMTGLSPDFLKRFGEADVPLTARGVISDGSNTVPAIFQTRGLFRQAEFGALARKNKGSTKITATLSYYKVTIDGEDIFEIDVLNKILIINGKDLLADHRTALGG